jgi:hypothetical protein
LRLALAEHSLCGFVAVFSSVDRFVYFFGRASRVRPGSRSLFLASP